MTEHDKKTPRRGFPTIKWLSNVAGSPPLVADVLHRALHATGEEDWAAATFGHFMQHALKARGLELGGARKAKAIPRAKLGQPYFLGAFKNGAPAAQAATLLWARSHIALRESVSHALSEAGHAPRGLEFLHSDPKELPDEVHRQIIETLLAKYPNDRGAVELMVRVLLSSDAAEPEVQAPTSVRFKRWIEELAALSADSEEWEDTPRLVTALEELAHRKLSERQAQSARASLRAIAAELDAVAASEAAVWFENPPRSLTGLIDALPLDALVSAESLLKELGELLRSLRELNAAELAPGQLAMKLRLADIAALELEYRALENQLENPGPPPEPEGRGPKGPGGVSPASPVTDVGAEPRQSTQPAKAAAQSSHSQVTTPPKMEDAPRQITSTEASTADVAVAPVVRDAGAVEKIAEGDPDVFVAPSPADQPLMDRSEAPDGDSAALDDPENTAANSARALEAVPLAVPAAAVQSAFANDQSEPKPSSPDMDEAEVAGAPTTAEANTVPGIDEGTTAARLRAPVEEPEARGKLLAALIREGDLRGAYWIARAEEAAGRQPGVPSWLLAATQGALLAEGPSSAVCSGVFEIASSEVVPEDGASRWLAVAASLIGSLRATVSLGLVDWLDEPEVPSAVRSIVKAVHDFVIHGTPFPLEVTSDLETAERRGQRMQQASERAAVWFADAQRRTAMYHGATEIWREVARMTLEPLLLPVVENDAERLEIVVEGLRALGDERIRTLIEEVDQRVRGRNAPRVVGSPVRWLIERCEEARAHAQAWVEIAQLDRSIRQSPTDWLTGQVAQVRRTFSENLAEAVSQIEGVVAEAPFLEAAAATVLLRVVRQTGRAMAGEQYGLEASPPESLRLTVLDDKRSLRSILAQRLVTLPTVSLPTTRAEQWEPKLEAIASALRAEHAAPRDVEATIREWHARRDFRFVPSLLKLLPAASSEVMELSYEAALQEARTALSKRVASAEASLERALVEDVISATERAEHGRVLEAIVPDDMEDFWAAESRIAELVETLDRARIAGLERHRLAWDELRRSLPGMNLSSEIQATVSRRVEAVLANSDVRSADELLAHLHDVREGAAEFRSVLFEEVVPENQLERFKEWLARTEALVGNKRGREVPTLLLSEVAEDAQRTGAKKDLNELSAAWGDLPDGSGAAHSARMVPALARLLKLLGVSLADGDRQSLTELPGVATASVWRVGIDREQAAPVPQFGSRANGVWRVVVVGDRAANAIDLVARQLKGGNEPTLIFYKGRLNLAQRSRLRMDLGRKVDALVVDEWLAYYLGLHARSDRYELLFRCTLPWTLVNPYLKQGGAVPPEMFYGRAQIVTDLERLDGTRIIYGGRQLGKSALLERVRRSFHAPSRHQYALMLDIREIGDQSIDHSPVQLWVRIRDELKEMKLIPTSIKTDKPEEILRYLREFLEQRPEARLLLFLDEADAFLDADARHGFVQVTALRALMEQSQGRCKVVFAGLHNVQRFQGIPNQPLAQFGRAQLVGPLEPREAMRLVVEPLEILGYRFADQEQSTSVLHILGFTNYHPRLLQLFCSDLLDSLQKREGTRGQPPPYVIRDQDIESVYRRIELRDAIRTCFEWTLSLDERYFAIALTCALDQLGQGGDFSRNFTVHELLKQVSGLWPAAFADVQTEAMRALLDEMVGLGILVRTRGGEYRLRSPNVVRLLGSENDLWNRMQELASKPAPQSFRADHHHPPLAGKRYSPWTHAQERQIAGGEPGLQLVMGSRATGLDRIGAALEQIVAGRQHELILRVPDGLEEPAHVRRYVEGELKTRPNLKRLYLLQTLSPANARSGALVDHAEALCQDLSRTKRLWSRYLFTLNPESAGAWCRLGAAAGPDRAAHPLMRLARWTPLGAARLLELAELASSGTLSEQVITQATGGWFPLIEEFQHRSQGGSAKDAIQAFSTWRRTSAEEQRKLWKALELESLPGALECLRVIAEHGEGGLLTDAADVAEFLQLPGVEPSEVEATVGLCEQLGCVVRESGGLKLAPLLEEALP